MSKDANSVVLSVIPEKGTSIYEKVLITLGGANNLPQKTEYFQAGQIKKQVLFKDYVKIGNIHRAQLIEVKNLATNRATNIELKDLQVNTSLSKAQFTTNALKP